MGRFLDEPIAPRPFKGKFLDEPPAPVAVPVPTSPMPRPAPQSGLSFLKALGGETLNQAKQFSYGAGNEATLGAYDAVKNVGLNMDPGRPQSMGQGIARIAGQGTGFVAGLPGKIGRKTVTTLAPMAGRIAKPAIEFGIGRAASTPLRLATGEATPGQEATDIAGTSLLAGAGEAAARSISKIPQNMKSGAGKIVNSLVKPLLKDFSYGKNPGRAVASEGIVAKDFDELGMKIGNTVRQRVAELKANLSSPKYANVRLDIQPNVIGPIDAALASANAYPETNAALITRLSALRNDILKKNLRGISLPEVATLKTEIGNLAKWTGNKSDDELINGTIKKIYGGIKDSMVKVAPETKAQSEHIADLLSAEIATKYRDKLMARQNVLKFAPKIIGFGTAMHGAVSGNIPAALAGLGYAALDTAAGTPAVKTGAAAGLGRLADSKAVQKAISVLSGSARKSKYLAPSLFK